MPTLAAHLNSVLDTPATPEPMFSVFDLAKVANVSHTLLRRQIKSGLLPAVRVGRRLRVSRTDWDNYLHANRSAGAMPVASDSVPARRTRQRPARKRQS